MEESLKIRIRDINQHIVCSLCAGYFVDATTITECLHTFCKSCVVKFLQSSKNCPQCNIKIHETQPLIHLKADRVMQDIVYKLVPGLFEGEEKRKQEFMKSRGLIPEQPEENVPPAPPLTSVYEHPEAHYYRNDEQMCLCLELYRMPGDSMSSLPALPKKFVRCSIRTQIKHVEVLLRSKLKVPQYLKLDILCQDAILDPNMSLKQVYLMYWHGRSTPMMLMYRVGVKNFPLSSMNNYRQESTALMT